MQLAVSLGVTFITTAISLLRMEVGSRLKSRDGAWMVARGLITFRGSYYYSEACERDAWRPPNHLKPSQLGVTVLSQPGNPVCFIHCKRGLQVHSMIWTLIFCPSHGGMPRTLMRQKSLSSPPMPQNRRFRLRHRSANRTPPHLYRFSSRRHTIAGSFAFSPRLGLFRTEAHAYPLSHATGAEHSSWLPPPHS